MRRWFGLSIRGGERTHSLGPFANRSPHMQARLGDRRVPAILTV